MSAFDSLMLRYQDRVFGFCYKLLGNYEDALELAQEVFLTCFRKLHTFAGRSKFSTWLYRLAVNHCKNFWQHRQRSASAHSVSLDQTTARAELPPLQISAPQPNPREQLARQQLLELIQQRLQLLTPEHRQVLILRYSEELSYDEIAEILGCPVGTVKSRINRARDELQQLLRGIFKNK
ncbi:MAG: sigma-70 family RNA polymerase sigma factor [Candidatus Sumerlaeia bacterium]|nr:sigma-70 family RNA polymerase sigma factor [Candidatus Sumerlaeia bacterium]